MVTAVGLISFSAPEFLLFSDSDAASQGGKVRMGGYKNINQVFIVLGVFNFG